MMAEWAEKKGINLLGTADFTHPLWFRQLKNELKEVSPGVYKLHSQKGKEITRFIISGEISSIYKQGNKQRRTHNLILVPNFIAAEKIIVALQKRGANLQSDGRPIIGLSSQELAELVFSCDPNCLLIPCHIWTPWFSLYGSRSGFDSIQECFGSLEKQIFAIETGLSSDPAMNWQIKELQSRQIVSFSDAHSPAKIGREATIFKSKNDQQSIFSYQDLVEAIKNSPRANWYISATIEFYPEEGKYHYDGHRNCQIRRSPKETGQKGTLCPVCGKPLTLGVLYRVKQLACEEIAPLQKKIGDVAFQFDPRGNRPPYVTLVPLSEIIAEVEGVTTTTKKVQQIYQEMISRLGSEFYILLESPLEKIKSLFGQRVGEGIEKVRKRQIVIEPGFDGVFGKVKIWQEEKKEDQEQQMAFF